jgi:hypothetical protein
MAGMALVRRRRCPPFGEDLAHGAEARASCVGAAPCRPQAPVMAVGAPAEAVRHGAGAGSALGSQLGCQLKKVTLYARNTISDSPGAAPRVLVGGSLGCALSFFRRT